MHDAIYIQAEHLDETSFRTIEFKCNGSLDGKRNASLNRHNRNYMVSLEKKSH
jgi:hypothetical protein